ncbi:MAG: FUSC family protein [Solirubrobacterales bacterium]|nr:FUSC family protein [Solirubrobacterales bacterium]
MPDAITDTPGAKAERLKPFAASRLASLRFTWLRIVQVSLAAGLAWLVATRVLGHESPFFAPIAVVLVLGLAIERRGRRAYEVALGVAIGIGVADLIVLLTGTGTWQVILVIGLAMAAAVLSGGGVMLVNQAAVSAVLVATLPVPDAAASMDRFVDALTGGAIALGANAITPIEPVRLVRRHLQPLLMRLSGTLIDIADALDRGNHDEAAAALERARGLDPAVREMKIAIEASQETISLSPLRRRSRGRVDRFATAAEPIDLMIRNTRVLARSAIRAVDLEDNVPELVTESIRDLATAVHSLDQYLAGSTRHSATVEATLRAAARSTAALEETSNLSVSVIVSQVRSTSTDLLLSLGVDRDDAVDEVRSARQRLKA